MSDQKAGHNEERHARELLAPLYGEAKLLESDEAAALEATRDLVNDWMHPGSVESALSSSARSSVLDLIESPSPAGRVSTLAGTVWIRRGGAGSSFPMGDNPEVRRGDLVITARGSRAMLLMADGSSIMIREESELEVGAPAGLGERLALLRGRIYAWIEKQHAEVFAVRTPCGFASVVGTEFDLQTDLEGNLALIVTEGQVNFRPASDTAREVALRRNEMLEHRNLNVTRRRVATSEARRLTAWANENRRGQVSGALVGLVTLVIIAAVAGFFFKTRSETASATVDVSSGKASPASGGNASVSEKAESFNLFVLQPGGERSRTTTRLRGNIPGTGEVENVMTMRLDSMPGGRLHLKIEDGDVKKMDGTSVQGPANTYVALRGLSFNFGRNPQGEFCDPQPERTDTGGSDAFTMMMMVAQFNAIPERSALTPGQEWEVHRKGIYPPMPGAEWAVDMSYKFEGFQNIGEKRAAKIAAKGTITLRNVAIWKQEAPAYTRSITAKKMVVDASSTSIYEAATSRLIEATETVKTTMDMSLSMGVPGGKPLVQKLPDVGTTQTGTTKTEYLN